MRYWPLKALPGRAAALLLFLGLFCAVQGVTVRSVRAFGCIELVESEVISRSGIRAGGILDTVAILEARAALLATGAFDTLYVQVRPAGSDSADVRIFVRELARSEWTVLGGALSLTMFNETKLWGAISPGYVRRHCFGKPRTLILSVTFPYTWAAAADYEASGLLAPALSAGLSVSARSMPYQNSRYYLNVAHAAAWAGWRFNRFLSSRLSVSSELSKTWRVDTDRWAALDWQLLISDPGDISDSRFARYYPRVETAPSAGLGLLYDRRDDPVYARRGFALFAEARRVWIQNLRTDYAFDYNQATLWGKFYASPARRHILAAYARLTARDQFDPERLGHRLIFYDDGAYFPGFRSLGGSNLAFLNLEYRFRLFEFNMDEVLPMLRLPPRREKILKRLSYAADAFVFFDNGAFYGVVASDSLRHVSVRELFHDELFTSAGIGGRAVYPRLGRVVTAGIALWTRKPGLPDEYVSRLFGNVSLNF